MPPILDNKYSLTLDATIVNTLGPSDSRHPHITFYGLRFSALGEKDGLVLHGFVGEHLLSEFHALWQMLMMAAGA